MTTMQIETNKVFNHPSSHVEGFHETPDETQVHNVVYSLDRVRLRHQTLQSSLALPEALPADSNFKFWCISILQCFLDAFKVGCFVVAILFLGLALQDVDSDCVDFEYTNIFFLILSHYVFMYVVFFIVTYLFNALRRRFDPPPENRFNSLFDTVYDQVVQVEPDSIPTDESHESQPLNSSNDRVSTDPEMDRPIPEDLTPVVDFRSRRNQARAISEPEPNVPGILPSPPNQPLQEFQETPVQISSHVSQRNNNSLPPRQYEFESRSVDNLCYEYDSCEPHYSPAEIQENCLEDVFLFHPNLQSGPVRISPVTILIELG